jgi:hypothetical protein
MNRAYSTIALQSLVAAAVIAAAPLAGAADRVATTEQHLELTQAPFVSVADRSAVRQAAIDARQQERNAVPTTERHLSLAAAPAASTLTREQVRAEAAEATRLGQTFSYDGKLPSEQPLAQRRQAATGGALASASR